MEISCADWMEEAQDNVEWKTFELALLNRRVLLP
jgi:hypothetical protein